MARDDGTANGFLIPRGGNYENASSHGVVERGFYKPVGTLKRPNERQA
jgi:hypothetical protein